MLSRAGAKLGWRDDESAAELCAELRKVQIRARAQSAPSGSSRDVYDAFLSYRVNAEGQPMIKAASAQEQQQQGASGGGSAKAVKAVPAFVEGVYKYATRQRVGARGGGRGRRGVDEPREPRAPRAQERTSKSVGGWSPSCSSSIARYASRNVCMSCSSRPTAARFSKQSS